MPTQHYTVTATPSQALTALREAATPLGWHADTAASGPLLLVLKRDASDATWGWSASISVVGDDDGVTSLVATTDDAPHLSSELREGHDLHELFRAIGAHRG